MVRSTPDPLTQAVLEWQRGSDGEAMVRLAHPHVSRLASRIRPEGCLERGDLIQEGMVKLVRCAEHYRTGGTTFWGYACKHVRGGMIDANRQIREAKSRDTLARHCELNRHRDRFYAENGYWPSERQLQEILGVGDAKWDRVWRESLSPPKTLRGGGMEDEASQEATIAELSYPFCPASLEACLPPMDDLHREILLRHHGGGETYVEIGRDLGLHPSTMFRQCERALNHVRRKLIPNS